MKRLEADFVPEPKAPRMIVVMTLAMALAAIALLLLGMRDGAETRWLAEQARMQIAQARAKLETGAAAERAAKAVVPPPPYAADAQAALRQQQFPLNPVLTALETVAVVGVRVMSVDITTGDATVRVQVEFSDYEALMKYLAELNAGEPVERWVLVSAQSNVGTGLGRPMASLMSVWRP